MFLFQKQICSNENSQSDMFVVLTTIILRIQFEKIDCHTMFNGGKTDNCYCDISL